MAEREVSVAAILVVDDSPTMRKMVKAALYSLQPEFGEGCDGLEAIQQMALRNFDLMVLDLNMPGMHGLEVIQITRASDSHRDLPILVLTTRAEEETRAAVLEAGANRYLTKPFQPGTLLTAVVELLAARSGRC